MAGEALKLQLHGDKEFLRSLKTLDKRVQRKVLRQALRKNIRTALDSIKGRTPTGNEPDGLPPLKSLLKISTRTRRGLLMAGVAIPTREELGIKQNDPYFWPFALEYGHALPGRGVHANTTDVRTRKGKRKGELLRRRRKSLKDVAARPFIREGWDTVESNMAIRLIADMLNGIEKEWAKG